jgi:hypothetical protein
VLKLSIFSFANYYGFQYSCLGYTTTHTLVRPHLDSRAETTQDPRQRHKPSVWEDFPENERSIFQGFRSKDGETMVLKKNMFVENLLPGAILRRLSDDEMAAYRAPFANAGEDRIKKAASHQSDNCDYHLGLSDI